MINVMITGTQTASTLSLIDPETGVDWVKDFIGNYGAFNDDQFVWEETHGVYFAAQDTYDWWAKVIADHSELSIRIEGLKSSVDPEEVLQVVSQAADCDLEDMADRVNHTLDEVYGT